MLIPFGWLASSGAGGGSYELITTVSLTSAAATITFSDIPQTYTHLQIRAIAKGDSAQGNLRLNSALQNHQEHLLQGNSSAVGAGSAYVWTYIRAFNVGTLTNNFGVMIADIVDYSSSFKKPVVKFLTGYTNPGQHQITFGSGFNPNATTSPITSIQILNSSFHAGSRFSLYGIKG